VKGGLAERAAPPAGASITAGLAKQQRERERALKRVARLRARASAEIERLLTFLDASDIYASTELEEQVDDQPCDDNELDGPENGEDEESDPAEPSLGSVGDLHFDQTRWADGCRRDLEQDGADSGIADPDGLLEQVGCGGWQGDRTGMG
jgi:hypothetical protein